MRETFGSRDRQVGREAAVLKGDRRKQPRAQLLLHGRYLLTDRREYPCTVIDASASAVALAAPERGKIGDKVVVYFEDIGRVEGEVVRHLDDGFVMRLVGRSRAAQALAELVERQYRAVKSGQGPRD
jgi:hypothetical protein